MVKADIAPHTAKMSAVVAEAEADLLSSLLPDPAALDLSDRVLRLCRQSANLSVVGRQLFAYGKAEMSPIDCVKIWPASDTS